MSLTYGFYNSVDGDRTYDAEQMGRMFDGIILDGVFEAIGGGLAVEANSGMTVAVRTGRAWFDHTWLLNDSSLYITLENSEISNTRIDSIVIEIDKGSRTNSIKALKGVPAAAIELCEPPELIRTSLVSQYRLCNIRINPGIGVIDNSNITSTRGTLECPWVRIVTDIAGRYVTSLNGETGDLNGVKSFNGRTGVITGVDSFNGRTGAITGVDSFNGQTGAVTGVDSFNGQTGAVTGVSSFNGDTGDVTGVESVNGETGNVYVYDFMFPYDTLNSSTGKPSKIFDFNFNDSYEFSGYECELQLATGISNLAALTISNAISSSSYSTMFFSDILAPNTKGIHHIDSGNTSNLFLDPQFYIRCIKRGSRYYIYEAISSVKAKSETSTTQVYGIRHSTHSRYGTSASNIKDYLSNKKIVGNIRGYTSSGSSGGSLQSVGVDISSANEEIYLSNIFWDSFGTIHFLLGSETNGIKSLSFKGTITIWE